MGLLKEKKLSNGIITKYHKIDSILINTEERKINVKINSYVDESIRTIEKENQNKKIQAEKLNDFIDKNIGTEDEKILEEIKEKTNLYNELIDTMVDTSTFVVANNTYTLPYNTNISFEDIYNELKQLDDFKDSEDVLDNI